MDINAEKILLTIDIIVGTAEYRKCVLNKGLKVNG